MESDGLRLLALDGGGIRGLSELLILQEIMKRIKAEEGLEHVPKPCEYFDIIGGTSTGGLIAILLGRLCMSVEDAIKEYINFARKVFSKKKRMWQDGRFKASTLEAAIKDIVARYDESKDENARMKSDASERRECKTFICAIPALNMFLPRLFRSYSVRFDEEYNSTIWEAARATCAAPTFFKRIFIGVEPKEEFVDAALGCNNPTAEVLKEAQNLWGMKHPISCIVSIGTGHPKTVTLRRPEWLQRLLPTDLVSVLAGISMDCERLSDKFEREYGEGSRCGSEGEMDSERSQKTYFRFNVHQGLQSVNLAEWTRMGEVKTHTVQYLHSATVTIEVDRIRDVLRVRRKDVELLT